MFFDFALSHLILSRILWCTYYPLDVLSTRVLGLKVLWHIQVGVWQSWCSRSGPENAGWLLFPWHYIRVSREHMSSQTHPGLHKLSGYSCGGSLQSKRSWPFLKGESRWNVMSCPSPFPYPWIGSWTCSAEFLRHTENPVPSHLTRHRETRQGWLWYLSERTTIKHLTCKIFIEPMFISGGASFNTFKS